MTDHACGHRCPAARRDARHHHPRSRACSRSTASTSCSAPARCTRSWARTAPASRRSSRRSPGVYADRRGHHHGRGRGRGSFGSTADAQGAGISTVYQEVNLCTNLSVGENVMLGHEPRRRRGIDWRATHREAARHLAEPRPRSSTPARCCRATRSPSSSSSRSAAPWCSTPRCSSSTSRRRASTATRSSGSSPSSATCATRVSPSCSSATSSTRSTRSPTASRSCATAQLVGEYRAEDLPRGALVTKMIGRAIDELEAISSIAERDHRPHRRTCPACHRARAPRRPRARPTSTSTEGEVVGIAGLLGSGRTELVRLLYGADRADAGQIEIDGVAVRHHRRRGTRSPTASRSPPRTAAPRASSPTSPSPRTSCSGIQARRGWLRQLRTRRAGRRRRASTSSALGVRPADPDACSPATCPAATSRRSLLARWLATAPQLIILDEPTRGIDVGAKADIQRKVAELSAQGLSVIFISSELEEVLRLAQRVVVMRDRRQIGELESTRPRRRRTHRLHGQRRQRGASHDDASMRHRLFWPSVCLVALIVLNTIVRPQFIRITRARRRALRRAHRHPPQQRAADARRTRHDHGDRHPRDRPLGRRRDGRLRRRHPHDHRRLGAPREPRHRGLSRSPRDSSSPSGWGLERLPRRRAADPADHRDAGADARRARRRAAHHRRLHHHGDQPAAQVRRERLPVRPPVRVHHRGRRPSPSSRVVERRTALGVLTEAVGINPEASRLAGVRSRGIIFGAYVAERRRSPASPGIIYSSNIMAADANAAGDLIELYAILAVVLGGTSLMGGKFSIAGTVDRRPDHPDAELHHPVPRRPVGREPGLLRGRRDPRRADPVTARAPARRVASWTDSGRRTRDRPRRRRRWSA